MQNKRGQGLSTNAIILIVLGIVILVVLIVGFTVGWGNIAPWISTNNVDTIITQCETACSTQSVYDFCMRKRDLKSDEEKLKDVTCNYLSKQRTQYGINGCAAVSCDNVVFVTAATLDDLSGTCEDEGNEGKTVQALIDNKLESYNC